LRWRRAGGGRVAVRASEISTTGPVTVGGGWALHRRPKGRQKGQPRQRRRGGWAATVSSSPKSNPTKSAIITHYRIP